MTKDEALKLALEALEEAHYKVDHKQREQAITTVITAIKEALPKAAPVQEPVDNDFFKHIARNNPSPDQRPWVGLTDEEREYWIGCNTTKQALARAIDNALKAKNT
jgi:hypothetical protein